MRSVVRVLSAKDLNYLRRTVVKHLRHTAMTACAEFKSTPVLQSSRQASQAYTTATSPGEARTGLSALVPLKSGQRVLFFPFCIQPLVPSFRKCIEKQGNSAVVVFNVLNKHFLTLISFLLLYTRTILVKR